VAVALPVFRFLPRWKEELVVTGPGGAFTLCFWMGIPTVCLPTEAAWPGKAPAWAADLWPALKDELASWCQQNNVALEIGDTASVWPNDAP
jgi:hypothetical protein